MVKPPSWKSLGWQKCCAATFGWQSSPFRTATLHNPRGHCAHGSPPEGCPPPALKQSTWAWKGEGVSLRVCPSLLSRIRGLIECWLRCCFSGIKGLQEYQKVSVIPFRRRGQQSASLVYIKPCCFLKKALAESFLRQPRLLAALVPFLILHLILSYNLSIYILCHIPTWSLLKLPEVIFYSTALSLF